MSNPAKYPPYYGIMAHHNVIGWNRLPLNTSTLSNVLYRGLSTTVTWHQQYSALSARTVDVVFKCTRNYPARTCAARGKAIGSVHLSVRLFLCQHKIIISWDLGIWAIRKHNETVKIVKKFAPLCFESAHERHKIVFLLVTPINRIPLCFLLMRTT